MALVFVRIIFCFTFLAEPILAVPVLAVPELLNSIRLLCLPALRASSGSMYDDARDKVTKKGSAEPTPTIAVTFASEEGVSLLEGADAKSTIGILMVKVGDLQPEEVVQKLKSKKSRWETRFGLDGATQSRKSQH